LRSLRLIKIQRKKSDSALCFFFLTKTIGKLSFF
jgi:hypothetical protein